MNNPYYNAYQQMQNQYQERLNALQQGNYQQQNFQLQHSEIVRVNGENGAKSYPLAPNSSALLLDENNPIVWLVQSDGAGYRTATPYTISAYEYETPKNEFETLEKRIEKLEEIINEKSDIKSNAGTTKSTKPNTKSSNKK